MSVIKIGIVYLQYFHSARGDQLIVNGSFQLYRQGGNGRLWDGISLNSRQKTKKLHMLRSLLFEVYSWGALNGTPCIFSSFH